MTLLGAIIAVLAMWAVQISALVGLGLLLVRLSRTETTPSSPLLTYFWPGLTVAYAGLQFWHLVFPIDWRISSLLFASGAFGLLSHRKFLRQSLAHAWADTRPVSRVLLALFLLWSANLALDSASSTDNGNYHLTSIRWASQHPIVKGLGNIDGHFAFNSTTFLHHAALEFGFWNGKSNHVATGSLLIVLLLQIFSNGIYRVAPLLLLTPLIYYMLRNDSRISSPGTDLPAMILLFVLCMLLWDLSSASISETLAERERAPLLAFLICCVSAAAATIKASSWIFVSISVLLTGITLLKTKNIPEPIRRNAAIASVSVLSIVMGTWIWRSILLSGYPLFPSAFLPMPTPWTIPVEYASWSGWFISSFARGAFTVHGNTGEHWSLVPLWVENHWRTTKIEAMLPIALSVAAIAAYTMAAERRAEFRSLFSANRLTLLPALAALAFWYIGAPAIRFGGAILWILAALLFSAAIGLIKNERRRYLAAIAICAMPALSVGQHLIVEAKAKNASLADTIRSVLFVSCGSDSCFNSPLKSELVKISTRFGVDAYTPLVRDCTELDHFKCVIWDAPLPAAQTIRPTLAYLNPEKPMDGFFTRERPGEWARVFGDDVKAAQIKHGWSVRDLAMRFRVHPVYIRQALGLPAE